MKKLKLNSIRTKLIVSLVAICVIPLIVLGFGSYTQSKSILSKKLSVTSKQTLFEVNNGLSDYFNGLSGIVNMMSTNYDFVNAEVGDNINYIPDMLKGIKENNKDIFTTYYGTESGKFQIYPIQAMPDGFKATERPWYKLALEHKGQVVITLPFKDAKTGTRVVSLAKTVEKEGKVVGVVAMNVSLTALTEKMAMSKVGTSGYLFIADINGNIIAHPQKKLIGTNSASKLSIWNKVKSEDNGFVSYTYNGVKKFGVYETNTITGWKLVATLEQNELSSDTKSILQTTILIIIVMALISILVSMILSKGIHKNIKKLKEVFAKASDGDLTVSVNATTKDEFRDLAVSFNSMIKNISGLMNSVTKSSNTVLETSTSLASMSEEVTTSIAEVASAIGEVSIGATAQAQSAQDGAALMEDLSSKIDKISNDSNEMDKISSTTKELGSKGLLMIDALIKKSNKTKATTKEVNNIVQDMNESTKKINAISETIADITEQTNLLSLNASIESARAGEAGKGFAVVAEEIRKLAEQSKNSTEEIKLIIAGIQEKSGTAVEAIKSTEFVVNEQDIAVGQTKDIFSEILKSIEILINKVDEIKVSVAFAKEKKQSTVSEIENISSVSEETASASQEVTASTEEITATMEELTRYSSRLQALAGQLGIEINKFKI
ncbi:methyl-accepting chemotaxis protein [Clostridium hydrogenum]|uniref:methyl-accepting chemotaxis protein n=1 Tax=Clostridium hydrogenum TaxID=2855764 RepID=UPI001F275E75|nr:methyl-accepting chemotaxis protein [Clostridium hydrogenum]